MNNLIERETAEAPDRLNVYWCPHCQFWHVGHRKANKEKANVSR